MVNDMSSQMVGVRLTEKEEREIKKIVKNGFYISTSEFIRDSVRKNLASLKVIEMRKISKETAKKEIMEYMKTHKEAYGSDIAEDLEIELDIVFAVMKELRDKGVVE